MNENQHNDSAPVYLPGGFLGLYLFNRFLNLYICNEYACETFATGIIPMVGIGFHSFLDGIIYSVTFNVSIFTGVLAAVGMVLHEFSEGIVTFLLLERGGFRLAQWASDAVDKNRRGSRFQSGSASPDA